MKLFSCSPLNVTLTVLCSSRRMRTTNCVPDLCKRPLLCIKHCAFNVAYLCPVLLYVYPAISYAFICLLIPLYVQPHDAACPAHARTQCRLRPPLPRQQVNWKKLAGRGANQLAGIVNKLDEQVNSVGAPLSQKSDKSLETAKARRRKHYRLQSEEKPTFPLQSKNFYNHVMENKEIVKTLAQLSACTLNVKTVSGLPNILNCGV